MTDRAGPEERRGTPDQRRAIDTVGRDLCVVAGAGTGKTFVLTERLVQRVVRDRVPLRDVLAITFTEKAAAEMKERLAQALAKAGRPGARQDVEDAAISTVHAFCARLLREHAVAAGVDPSFGVLDEVASDRLLAAALARLVDEWRDADPEAFAALATLGGEDPAETLTDLYRAAQSSGHALGDFVRDVPHLPPRRAALAPLRRAVAVVAQLDGTGTDAARKRVAAVLAAAAALPSDDALDAADATALGAATAAVTAVGAAFDLRCGEPAKSALADVRDAVAAVVSVLAEHAMTPLRAVAARAVERLDDLYDEEKGRGERLDFADLERHAVALLASDEGVRDEVRRRRPEVLVDEFQDTNPVQARLVDLLRTDGRLFVVGDPKQAIYGFRGADVTVFEDRLRAAAAAAAAAAATSSTTTTTGGESIVTLRHSFRSRPEVLGFVNRLFEGGVGRGAEGDGAGGDAAGGAGDVRLAAGRRWAPSAEPCVEVRVATADSMPEARADEAAWIAERILALVESGFPVAAPTRDDPLAVRPCEFGDVAVLLRATTNIKILEQELVARDVPYLVVKGRGFFRAREVIDVAHLFATVENPRDDLTLAAVLRSPACGVSDDGLFALCAARTDELALCDVLAAWAAGDLPLPDLPADDVPPLRAFAATLADLRARRGADGVAALVERALGRTRLDVLALGRPNGRQRAANLRKVRVLARAADAEGLSLREFVDELRTLREREVREAEAAVAGAARGAVSVMTVHVAKGLEFPVVFVPDVGRLEVSRGGRVVSDVRGGVGLASPTGSDRDVKPWAYTRLRERRSAAEAAESERLLYVAVTRAADHLVLTGAFTGEGEGHLAQRRWWGRIEAALTVDGVLAGAGDVDVGPGADGPDEGEGAARTVVRIHPGTRVAPQSASARTLLGRIADRLAAGTVPPLALRDEARREAAALLDEAARTPPPPDRAPFATNVSALTAFARCPHEYRLRHVVGVPEDDDLRLFGARSAFDVDDAPPAEAGHPRPGDDDEPDVAPSSRAVGRAAHAALERLVPTFRRDAADEVRAALAAETGGAAPDPDQVETLVRWVEGFRASDLGREVAALPRADVRREQSFLLAAGRTAVRGQIDLLFHSAGLQPATEPRRLGTAARRTLAPSEDPARWHHGGGAAGNAADGDGAPDAWTVVDYKTGALDAAHAEHALQMRLYALGVRAVTGTLPARLVLWSLPRAAAVAVPCGEAEVAAVEALLREFGERTRSGDLRPRPEPPCGTCRVAAACVAKPAHLRAAR